MPLQRQVISIPMAGSLDTKTDAKQLPIGKLLELENGFRKRNGEFVKRYGYETLTRDITPSGTIADGRRMAIYGNELNLITNKSMYTYSDENDKFVLKGPLETLAVNQRAIIANSYQQTTADSATAEGVAVFAWEDSRALPTTQVRYSVIDRSNNATLVGDALLVTGGVKPRCVAIGTSVFVFVQVANTLNCYIFAVENPTASPTVLTIGADAATAAIADMIPFNGAVLVAYATTASSIKLLYVTPRGTIGGSTTGYPTTATYAVTADKCLTLFARDNNRFNLAYVNSTDGVRHVGIYSNLDTTNLWLTNTQLDAETNVRNITGFQSGNIIHTYFDTDPTDKWKREVKDIHRRIDTGAVTGGAGNLKSVSLAGKLFYTDDNGFVPVAFWSTEQPTLFLLRNDGDISAKMLQASSAGETAKTAHLPNVYFTPQGEWAFATPFRSRILSENATLFTLLGITEVGLDFNDEFICDSAQLGENLLITSGYLQCYDGVSIFEAGFHTYPDNFPAPVEINTGGIYPYASNNDTAQYIVVYEWTDAKGQIHRSTPSAPITVKATNSNRTFTLEIPTLHITDRKGTRANVVIAIYRTTIGASPGTLFYKVTDNASPLYNDTNVQSVTWTDRVLSDAAFIKRELLYTTGGVLENIAPPAAKIIARFKNRMFLAGTETGTLWYSKEHVPGEAVNFVDVFQIKVDDTGGRITSLGELDDKLIIFKANTIFALTGDGPLATGAQNTFSVPQLIASDVGCVDPYSVVRTRDGLMFKSKKGIYLLDRGLQVQYIGAEVEAWNSLTITSAAVVDDQNQVRFTTAEGRCLIYDLFFKQWYTFTNIQAVDSAMWQGKYVFLKATGEIWRETKDKFLDVDVPIISKYVLALMQFAQVQGFQRIFKINILGENLGTHGLKIEVGYDFRDFYEERFIVYPDSVLFDSVYGDDTVWGEAGTLWGGNYDGVYQFQIRPRQQRCQALKLKIEDFFGSGTGTAGFALSNVTAEMGIEPNVARIAKTKIIAP